MVQPAMDCRRMRPSPDPKLRIDAGVLRLVNRTRRGWQLQEHEYRRIDRYAHNQPLLVLRFGLVIPTPGIALRPVVVDLRHLENLRNVLAAAGILLRDRRAITRPGVEGNSVSEYGVHYGSRLTLAKLRKLIRKNR